MSINLSDISTSDFLASDDYKAGQILPVATIERVEVKDVAIPNTTKKQAKVVIFFKGVPKGYVVNKNVARKIGAALGETKNLDKTWIGARVQLFIAANVRRPDGGTGNAFRLQGAWPAGAVLPDEKPPAPPAAAPTAPTGQGAQP